MFSKPLCGLMIACGIIMSCHQNDSKSEKVLDATMAPIQQADADDQAAKNELMQADTVGTHQLPALGKPAPVVDWNKKIIKNATVKLEVKDLKTYNESIYQKIKRHNAYIAQEDNSFTDYKNESILTIKVPVIQFEDLVNDLSAPDVKIIERSIRSEDVTGQVVDTKSRLEAKKQMRLKYLDFLRQSKNMEEVLKVQAEINDIQEEIESATGRISYLGNQSAYSTIQLTFYQPLLHVQRTPVPEPGFFSKALMAFKNGAEVIKSLLLGMIAIWPLLLILFAALYLWKRKSSLRVRAA